MINRANEAERLSDGIYMIVDKDLLREFLARRDEAAEIKEQRPPAASPECRRCGQEAPDGCLHHGQDAPLKLTVSAADGQSCAIIQTCPSYYIIYKVGSDGKKEILKKGKRGTVYGLIKKVTEEIGKNQAART